MELKSFAIRIPDTWEEWDLYIRGKPFAAKMPAAVIIVTAESEEAAQDKVYEMIKPKVEILKEWYLRRIGL